MIKVFKIRLINLKTLKINFLRFKQKTSYRNKIKENRSEFNTFEETLSKRFNSDVTIKQNSKGKGSISINFDNNAKLDELIKLLQ